MLDNSCIVRGMNISPGFFNADVSTVKTYLINDYSCYIRKISEGTYK